MAAMDGGMGSPTSKDKSAKRRFEWTTFVALAAVCAVSLCLRLPTSSLAAVLESVRGDLAMSHTAAGILTAVPVGCMAVAPLVLPHAMRWGTSDQWIKASVALIAASLALRAISSTAVLFLTAFIAGLGVAALQVILPSEIKERFEDPPTVTSLYATIVNVGAGLATGLTAWVAASLGSWRLGLAIWVILAVLALCMWAFSPRHCTVGSLTQASRVVEFGSVWCDQTAWRIGLFAGSGSLIFWSVTTWLPSIYIANGWDQAAAGLLASELAFVQVAASFAVTALTGWGMSLLTMRLISIAAGVAGLLILAWVPDRASWPCILLLGGSIGGLFPLAVIMPVEIGMSQRHVQLLTAMSLSVGYLIASIGPVAIGSMRDLSGGFQAPFTSLALVFGILGLIGAQPLRRK